MSFSRNKIQLCALVLLMVVTASAQGQGLKTFELFSQPDRTWNLDEDYRFLESAQQIHEGFFATWEGIRWSIAAPRTSSVGFPDLTRTVFYGPHPEDLSQPDLDPLNMSVIQSNTMDTSELAAIYTEGDRIQFGRIEGHHGWMCSTYRLKHQTQQLVSSGVAMVFEDNPSLRPYSNDEGFLWGIVGYSDVALTEPVVRALPLTFDEVFATNRVEHWSVDLSYVRRTHQLHHGGFLEWHFGVRYFEFNEMFGVEGRASEDDAGNMNIAFGTILANSVWETSADNHVVGPQIALRWVRKNERWTISADGKFLAGLNSQNIRQRGTLASELTPPGGVGVPLIMGPTSFNHAEFASEFSPMVEFRANIKYAITSLIDINVGWTGIWMDGIARPSGMIDYTMPEMGITMVNNTQDVFVHGFSIGLNVNR